MSNAISGVGTLFKRGDGASSETFTTVAECYNIDGPTQSREKIEVTSFDSTGGRREFIPGFIDSGEITVSMNFTRDEFETIRADFEDVDATQNYQIVLPDTGATTLGFTAFPIGMPMAIPFDDRVTLTVTYALTGEITLTS